MHHTFAIINNVFTNKLGKSVMKAKIKNTAQEVTAIFGMFTFTSALIMLTTLNYL